MARVLEHCTAADLGLLCTLFEQLQFSSGEVVVAEGTRVSGLYVVRRGRVRLTSSDPARATVLGTLEPDDVFGAGALLENGRARVSLVATSDVEIERIDGEHLSSLLTLHPDVCARVYRSVAAAVARRIDRMIVQLGPTMGWGAGTSPPPGA